MISPNIRPGTTSNVDYDTSSYLKTVQTMLGVDPLPCDPTGGASTMADLFTVPM